NKEKQGSEILTVLLQALKNIVSSNSLPVQKVLSLIDITAKELPPKVLGSPAYQVADMDLLNGTPALFLIQLPFHNNLLECCVTDERFFVILETLVGYVLSGPTSPLAFSESVICVINQSAKQVENKEHLWRMWSTVVNPLTEWINETNEVNQGDALEHNFSAVYSALLLPVSHIFPAQRLPQPTLKSLLGTWSDLYRAFARCAALVATAEENVCCEELCAKIISGLEGETPVMFSMMDGLTHVVSVMVDCISFAPYGTKYQPKARSPQTPTDWSRKKKEPLGKLSSLFKLLVMLLNSFHELSSKETHSDTLVSVGPSLLAALHHVISHISLPSVIGTMFATFSKPLAGFYEKTKLAEVPEVYSNLNNKLEKLLAELLQCVQSHCTGSYDSELLEQLSPLLSVLFQHRSKQIRNQCAQFWNSTFAKSASLTYPQELKCVLSQAKKNIPLLLPCFESIEIAEEYSGPFSDTMENSQLHAKISGMEVNLVPVPRQSVLVHTSEVKSCGKGRASRGQGTAAKLKLEFSLSKMKSEILLEEEKSADFVFIPPETKQRVLTEHQKEVLRSKRADIPAMYNNLDASQDTTLFSQYTQSQEDSQEVPPVTESVRGGAETKPQEGDAKSEGCSNGSASAPEGAAQGTESPAPRSESSTAEVIPEEPSAGEGLDTSSAEADSKETSAGNENTSNVSNSSACSDVISGTPQPVSRRQSFITLERFSASGNRPFGLSALSTLGSATLEGKQDNANVSKAAGKAEKPGEEGKKPSKSEPEPVSTRRLTRRQRQMELQEIKSRLFTRSEQESSDSVERHPELCSSVEDVEHILLSHSQTFNSIDEDIKKVEEAIAEIEKTQALDVDCKENTPPDTTAPPEQATGDDTQGPPVPPHQKVLRRSMRRRSDMVEGTSGSQEKEDCQDKSLQKRDKRKEDEKSGQKKMSQAKDYGAQKPKAVPGNTTENRVPKEISQPERTSAGDSSSKDSPASCSLDEEVNTSARRPEDHLKADGDSGLSATGQKVVESPRYYTRRCSQGLIFSSSEAMESTRKRRHKVKTPSEAPESKLKDGQAGSHEVSSQGNESKSPLEADKGEPSPEASIDAVQTAEPCGLENQAIPTAAGEAVGSSSSKDLPAAQDTSMEQNRNSTSMESVSSPCVPEQDGKAAEEDTQDEKQTSTGDCSSVVPDCAPEGKASGAELSSVVPDSAPEGKASGAELASLQAPECRHKRSKRVKKFKSCDCCAETLKLQFISFTVSKAQAVRELNKLLTTPVQTPEGAAEVSAHSSSEESLFLAPCAMSTPLHPPEEPGTFHLESQGTSVDTLQGSSVVVKENPEWSAGETTDSLEELKEPADQEPTEQVLPGCAPSEPGESCLATGSQREEVNQNGQLEVMPEALTDSKPEENQVDELEGKQGDEREAVGTLGVNCVLPNEIKEEGMETEIAVPENTALENSSEDSPQKVHNDSLGSVSESPNGTQTRCTWSPSASPSTSILKRGVKRSQDDDCLSPVNKMRRVSFANPIYQEGLADDIDRRSPVIRSHSSPSSRSLKTLSAVQPKHITTPTKGFLSPGSRTPKFKSSKKCLITEMAQVSLPCPDEHVYPALADCKAPVDVILPQITSNICARGLEQLIRAKNIKTVGDLSTLTASEVKTLPIRSPKIFNVKKALKGYHEQQVKSRVPEEMSALEDAEKPVNGLEDKSLCADEEKLATALAEPAVQSREQPPADLPSQIHALAAQVTSEHLHSYSGSQLFEMHETLAAMTSCILRNLQSRWKSPPHKSSE
ncbi:PREDICTED: telomere-associated protein RIF1, partial [Acanthisitta chloris]|uniref:telomere-associated protein RIF1 n=1 Tax=Acanthisitta chloris TaxID=57068 RepID=UPI0004F0F4E2